jgi:hypothetical protein
VVGVPSSAEGAVTCPQGTAVHFKEPLSLLCVLLPSLPHHLFSVRVRVSCFWGFEFFFES